ncbi:MAG TPA: pyruvate dehydrogenase (acetyl-transferring) E1 component subunit alpha [Gaiellaceae bacterium]|nr:pyruvate dehydrogenase (acetyl-transferring) E1 component subunit alpha [Gaiellaceae bacterium]
MARAVDEAHDVLQDREQALRLLRMMLLIRRFDERAEEQYTRARIGGYCHLSIGEEAANVGTIDCLEADDYLFASYRDHAAALAVGSSPAAVMAELFGKETGVARGYGGSMHLLDVDRRFLGGWGIVGGHLPIAVGAALALDYRDVAGAVLCQFGDGATNIGAFHEALNLAALWGLPIVFQVINNLYGMGTSVEQSSAEPELYKRSCAYRMHGERVDGNDLLAVREAAGRLLTRAREESKPALLETTTYRFRGHSVADAGKAYRTAEELASWRERDPITRYAELLREHDLLEDGQLESMRKEVADEISEAIREAAAAPAPEPDRLYENVYGDESWREQFARMDTAAPFGERLETRTWQS